MKKLIAFSVLPLLLFSACSSVWYKFHNIESYHNVAVITGIQTTLPCRNLEDRGTYIICYLREDPRVTLSIPKEDITGFVLYQ